MLRLRQQKPNINSKRGTVAVWVCLSVCLSFRVAACQLAIIHVHFSTRVNRQPFCLVLWPTDNEISPTFIKATLFHLPSTNLTEVGRLKSPASRWTVNLLKIDARIERDNQIEGQKLYFIGQVAVGFARSQFWCRHKEKEKKHNSTDNKSFWVTTFIIADKKTETYSSGKIPLRFV